MAFKLVAKVVVDVEGLKAFQDALKRDLRRRSNGPVRRALLKWEEIYTEFLRRRFLRYSRGGGNWPPLAQSTIDSKRQNKNRILIETRTMFEEMLVKINRRRVKTIANGIRIDYGIDSPHPNSNLSIGRLTEVHQLGEGNVPARPIIVPPSRQVEKRMVETMSAAVGTTIRRSRRSSRINL